MNSRLLRLILTAMLVILFGSVIIDPGTLKSGLLGLVKLATLLAAALSVLLIALRVRDSARHP